MDELPAIRDVVGGADAHIELLKTLFASAPVAFQVYRSDGHCLLNNDAVRELFGAVPPPEYDIFTDDVIARSGMRELVRRGFAGEVIRIPPLWYDPRELTQLAVTEGRRVAVEGVMFPLFDRDGAVGHVAIMYHDVTARMELAASEASLRESEARCRIMSECSPIGIVMTDPAGNVVYDNPSVCKIANTAPGEILGRGWANLVHPDDRERVFAKWAETVATGAPNSFVCKGRRNDGAVLQVHIRTAPMLDGGRCLGHVALIEDVTERVATHEALRQQTELFQAVFDDMDEGMLTVDPDGMPLMWNRAAANMLRIPLPVRPMTQWPEGLGAFLPDQTTPWPMDQLPLARSLRGEKVDDVQMFFRLSGEPQGIWTNVSARPLTDAHGQPRGAVSVFRDVTAGRAARLAVEQARKDLRRVIDQSPDGVAIVRQAHLIYANSAMAQALGCTNAADLIGRDIGGLADGGDLNRARESWERANTATALTEVRCQRPDGQDAILELSMTRLDEFDGAPAVLVMARDITERKALQAQMLMSERLASIGTLAAGVAHEINNPLASLVANLDLAMRELSAAVSGEGAPARADPHVAQVRECLRDAAEAADRVRFIVRDLKLLARRDDEGPSAVNLRWVLDSATRMAASEIRHRAKFVKDYDDLPNVEGTEVRLGQVFLNLLINAVQAIPEGQADQHEIRISARFEDAGRVVVEVSDTGRGIAPEHMGRIFDPFFTTKSPGEGTGLGLSICHRIVAESGGRIDAESEVGKGSVFRVTLRPREGGERETP
jgi:PAS domain S-box-containing protein